MGSPQDFSSFDIIGGEDRGLTDSETVFLQSVVPSNIDEFGLDAWRHSDEHGPWLIVSYDLVRDGVMHRVLRVDFDGSRVCCGWSPRLLNGDSGVRASAAGVNLSGPHGLVVTSGSPVDLGTVVTSWLESEIETFIEEKR